MKKIIPIKTLYLLAVISIGLVTLAVGSTYAIFTAESEIINPISFTSNLAYKDEVLETVEVSVPAGKMISTKLKINNNSGDTLNYVAWYSSKVNSSNFEVGVNSGTPTGTLASGGSATIDVSIINYLGSDVKIILGIASSSGAVTMSDSMIKIPNKKISITLINHINTLYKNNVSASSVNIDGGTYYYAENVRLMNDGLDITGSLTNDINRGNIRYYGEDGNELKNYIYFNCDDYSVTTTCEVWRILGIIDGKIKIMKNSPIGELSWDTNYGDTADKEGVESSPWDYENDWNTSSLRALLNGPYYDSLDTTYYNYESSIWEEEIPEINFNGNSVNSILLSNNKKTSNNSAKLLYYSGCSYFDECSEVYLNFGSNGTGITEATKTNNLISNSTWYINKIIDDHYYPYEMYINEQTGSNTLDNNIALIDYSDYLFSHDLNDSSSTGWIDTISEDAWLLSSLSFYDDYSCYYEYNYNSCTEDSNCSVSSVLFSGIGKNST